MLPFLAGSIVGATLGANIFIALSAAILQGIIGIFILILTWLPKITTAGGERKRFAVVGFVVTFLGIFVSATGTLLASFIASAAPTRQNHVATMGALMVCSHVTKIVAFGVLGNRLVRLCTADDFDGRRRGVGQLGRQQDARPDAGTDFPHHFQNPADRSRLTPDLDRSQRARLVLALHTPEAV